MTSNSSIRVQFRISNEVGDFVEQRAKDKKISVNEAAKELLTERCLSNDDLTIMALKSSVRQLTIIQRYVSEQIGESLAAELFEKAYKDELEILKSLGVDNG